ncbi:catalase family protein [Sphingomonas sp. 3P27F8]|jgi:catalase|uniref:catalase family protein n=1 Tax=Sphingomonas sp. 3P27F8 TaxID=2502213 RepID=UPI0010F913F7|nr:catalase family protein [Sphingomonas sp. 3P27F8]
MTASPVRYSDAVEKPIDNEEQVHRDLIDTMRSITETTSQDYGHAVRSVHAKAHGILSGELEIDGALPPELAQGLFAGAGRYRVLMRFSTNPGDLLDDSVSAPRGLALKILDVEGERLPDSAGETTQNLILVNAPAFAAPDAKAFLGSLKQLAATTDKAEWAKKLLSATLRGVENAIEAVGGKSAMISTMGGTPITHPLGDSYYSQVPFRYGDHIAKFALVPVSPNLTQLTGDRVNTTDRPDALREVIRETIIEQGGTWELRVQLNTDLEKMPVEDASVEWDEERSPYRTVGRITVEPQMSLGTDLAGVVDEQTFFSPWHGLAAHRPLGSVNRSRRQAYEMSAEFRAKFNGCPMHDTAAFPTA